MKVYPFIKCGESLIQNFITLSLVVVSISLLFFPGLKLLPFKYYSHITLFVKWNCWKCSTIMILVSKWLCIQCNAFKYVWFETSQYIIYAQYLIYNICYMMFILRRLKEWPSYCISVVMFSVGQVRSSVFSFTKIWILFWNCIYCIVLK